MYWMWRKGWDYEQLKKFGSHAGQHRGSCPPPKETCVLPAGPGPKGLTTISTEPDSFDGTAIQPPSGDNLGSSPSGAGPIKKGFPSMSDCP
jgi:hypothetical protein